MLPNPGNIVPDLLFGFVVEKGGVVPKNFCYRLKLIDLFKRLPIKNKDRSATLIIIAIQHGPIGGNFR